jgi:hypothetical protein
MQKIIKLITIGVLFMYLCSFVYVKGQKYVPDCNAKPISFVGSLEMGVHNGMITEGFKLGVWQNNKPNGFTLLGGYQVGVTTFNGKGEQTSEINTFYGELGYKLRVAKPIIIHGYTGVNLVGKYAGVSVYTQIQDDLMFGAYYKQGIIGGTLVFAF